MGRGGRGGGRGRGFGHGHHGRGGHGSAGINWDAIAASMVMPMVQSGKYAHVGSEMNVINQLQNFNANVSQYQQMAMTQQMLFPPVTELDLTIIGSKTYAGNTGCVIATLVSGMFFIIPLFFICCAWWKKICAPVYEIRNQTYAAIKAFLVNNPQIKVLNLKVVDSTFNSIKARSVYEIVQANHLIGLTLQNCAEPLNQNQNQHDNFIANMMPIKSLPTTSVCVWGSQILP